MKSPYDMGDAVTRRAMPTHKCNPHVEFVLLQVVSHEGFFFKSIFFSISFINPFNSRVYCSHGDKKKKTFHRIRSVSPFDAVTHMHVCTCTYVSGWRVSLPTLGSEEQKEFPRWEALPRGVVPSTAAQTDKLKRG